MKILQLATAHPRYDSRVFLKESRSLVSAGHSVRMVVRDGAGDEVSDGVEIVDLGLRRGLFRRLGALWSTYRAARDVGADVICLHEPELPVVGWLLARRGARIAYDAHEDHPRRLLHRRAQRRLMRPAARLYEWYENLFCRHFDLILAATPKIQARFLCINPNTVLVRNFPLLDEVAGSEQSWAAREDAAVYVGGISRLRGIQENLVAVQAAGVKLYLAGRFGDPVFESQIRAMPAWRCAEFLGYLNRQALAELLRRPRIGLVTLLPAPNYVESLPVKMFEYLAAGIPVVASNFAFWREIIEKNGVGICVDPANSEAIAAAIRQLLDHPDEARRMGERGRRLVLECCNWGREERVLLDAYHRLAEVTRTAKAAAT